MGDTDRKEGRGAARETVGEAGIQAEVQAGRAADRETEEADRETKEAHGYTKKTIRETDRQAE